MNVTRETPPNFEDICKAIPEVKDHKGAVFTYGDKIYAPNIKEDEELPAHLMVHEQVHEQQQGENPAEWWSKYLADKEFRLEQEVEAYRAQYQFIRSQNTGLPLRAFERTLFNMASELAGPLYGNLITHAVAEIKIKRN